MQRVAFAAVLACLAAQATTASATVSLTVFVNPDGTAYLQNTGDELSLDGLSFLSASGRLDAQGWLSIQDQVAADPLGMVAKYGTGVLGAGEVTRSGDFVLAELIPGGFLPMIIPADDILPLGSPFRSPWAPGFDVKFSYLSMPRLPAEEGEIVFLPEPSSWLLAGVGGVLFVASRRRFIR